MRGRKLRSDVNCQVYLKEKCLNRTGENIEVDVCVCVWGGGADNNGQNRTVCVLHSVERYCVCNAQCREVLCVYCTVQRGTVCVLHSVERHCVCTAQCREVLCVLHSVERHCVCTAQCREALCVYCTV